MKYFYKLKNITYKLRWTMYGKFWKIYLRNVFENKSIFKLYPNIQVFYANDEHLLKSGLLNHKNVIYNRKKARIAIVNDYEAVAQFCDYNIMYYKNLLQES